MQKCVAYNLYRDNARGLPIVPITPDGIPRQVYLAADVHSLLVRISDDIESNSGPGRKSMTARFGQGGGLFVTAPIGTEVKHTGEMNVFADGHSAMKHAADSCSRSRDFIVYELVERARLILDEPRIVKAE